MKHFYLKQKVFSIADRYKIYDQGNNVVYHCKGNLMSFARTKKLFDCRTDELLFILKRRLFTLLPRYYLLDKDGKQVAYVKKRISFLKQRLDIESVFGDMEIQGNVWIHDFQVSVAGGPVLEIHKKFIAWGDTYEITVHDEEHIPFYLALAVMIDDCLHSGRRRN